MDNAERTEEMNEIMSWLKEDYERLFKKAGEAQYIKSDRMEERWFQAENHFFRNSFKNEYIIFDEHTAKRDKYLESANRFLDLFKEYKEDSVFRLSVYIKKYVLDKLNDFIDAATEEQKKIVSPIEKKIAEFNKDIDRLSLDILDKTALVKDIEERISLSGSVDKDDSMLLEKVNDDLKSLVKERADAIKAQQLEIINLVCYTNGFERPLKIIKDRIENGKRKLLSEKVLSGFVEYADALIGNGKSEELYKKSKAFCLISEEALRRKKREADFRNSWSSKQEVSDYKAICGSAMYNLILNTLPGLLEFGHVEDNRFYIGNKEENIKFLIYVDVSDAKSKEDSYCRVIDDLMLGKSNFSFNTFSGGNVEFVKKLTKVLIGRMVSSDNLCLKLNQRYDELCALSMGIEYKGKSKMGYVVDNGRDSVVIAGGTYMLLEECLSKAKMKLCNEVSFENCEICKEKALPVIEVSEEPYVRRIETRRAEYDDMIKRKEAKLKVRGFQEWKAANKKKTSSRGRVAEWQLQR